MCDKQLTWGSDVFGQSPQRAGASTVFPGVPRVLFPSLFNVPVVVHDIRWLRADPDKANFFLGGRAVFAVLLCSSYDFPERPRFSTHSGAINVCKKLHQLQLGDHLPAVVTLIQKDDDSYDLT